MDERGQGIPAYASLLLAVLLIGFGVLLAAAPSLGGAPREVRAALRSMLVGDDKAPVDDTVPAVLPTRALPPSGRQFSPVQPVEPIFVVPNTALMDEGTPCASFGFTGAVHIEDGRFAFNPFTVVSRAGLTEGDDPLTSWKLILFEVFSLDAEGLDGESEVGFPVNQVVNLSIVDPFSRQVLLSASWSIAEIDVQGRAASINSALTTNLGEIRVNNAIESETLAALGASADGVLVLRLHHTSDVADALQGAAPLHAPISGAVYADSCFR